VTRFADADASPHAALDGWMRRDAGAVHAHLIARFGWGRAEMAEDALQDALVRALQTWPFAGVPDRPGGWLYTVAANRMLDLLRGAAERTAVPVEALTQRAGASQFEATPPDELSDPELAVLFAVCHPSLDPRTGIALALQVLSGFSLREIANALLLRPDAVAQRLSRAKRALRDIPGIAELPAGTALRDRLAVALDVVALLFNEGFEPSSGELPMRTDLCGEAIRLADALAGHPLTAGPEARALAALLNLLGARLPARLVDSGAVTLLPEQDRAAWDRVLLHRGLRQLAESAGGDQVSRYHLLAGIAATHATAVSLDETDWGAIVADYRLLIHLEDSPVHRLNLAVALQRGGWLAAAADEMARLEASPRMGGYFWFHMTRAEIAERVGDRSTAAASLETALALASTPMQTRFVRRRITGVSA